MSDPKVPNTSDSESPTLVPRGNTKLESAPPSPDSSEAQALLGGKGLPSASDAATIPPASKPAASDAPTLLDGRKPSGPAPPPRPSGSGWQLPALLPGMMLGGRYEILQTIGEGGMGAVYKARDRELDRFVALKVIRPELASDPSILARFKQELLLAHQVTHRNVIRIYDLGEAEGVKFITMEFIEARIYGPSSA